MNKENQKQLTLDDFRKRALDKLRNRKNTEVFEVEGYGPVPCERPSDNELLKYLNGAAKGAKLDKEGKAKEVDITPIAIAAKTLVYSSCKFLHDKEILGEADIEEPYDIAFALFGISETMKLAEKISDTFGGTEVQKDIKN